MKTVQRYFITGTDTDCGKTFVTCRLLSHYNLSKKAYAIKPIASGVDLDLAENSDIISLRKHNYQLNLPVNLWRFNDPVAPNLAANKHNITIELDPLKNFCENSCFNDLDYLFIEGAGGLMAPINDQHTWLDFIKKTQMPTILVVGLRLGCINYALLIEEAAQKYNLPIIGWIANCLEPKMEYLEENIDFLKQKLTIPHLLTLNYNGEINSSIPI